MPVTNPDALIDKGGILNTRIALHTAVTKALKEEGLDPFPKTRITLETRTYISVMNAVERVLREWGTPFQMEQIKKELSRRGYEVGAPSVVSTKKKWPIREVLMITLPLVGLVGIVMLTKRR